MQNEACKFIFYISNENSRQSFPSNRKSNRKGNRKTHKGRVFEHRDLLVGGHFVLVESSSLLPQAARDARIYRTLTLPAIDSRKAIVCNPYAT